MANGKILARSPQPTRRICWVLVVAVLVWAALLTSCGSDVDTAGVAPTTADDVVAATSSPVATALPATAAPATPKPSAETPTSADCSAQTEAVPEQDQSTARRLTAMYVERSGQCPSRQDIQELLYIWQQNREFWTDFPAQEERFFDANVGSDRTGVRAELVGLSFDRASALLLEDADFAWVQDSGPTAIGDMTMYESFGGLSVLLVVTRQGVVDSVYLLDQT